MPDAPNPVRQGLRTYLRNHLRAHISHWLPADTRAVELASALGLLLAASRAELFDGFVISSDHPNLVWAVMLAALAVLQTVGAVFETPPLRVLASFVGGLWWIWAGLAGDGGHVTPGDFAAIGLGVSLIYAFVLHAASTAAREWDRD